MKRLPSSFFRLLGGLIILFACYSCTSYKLATLNHDPIYPVDYVIPVTNDTKIDTINSLFDLKYKLRTDFNFRWDFAQYAMNQPYSWYWNNPRLDGIWRPYNRFDVYFHSHWFWTDWAWNYPFNYHSWGWYNWNRPYYFYGWNRPYRPWNNIWNTNYNNNNVVFMNGRRGSIVTNYNNRGISNSIITRYNKPRNNVINDRIDNIVREFRKNGLNVRVINNSNNDQIIRNNSRTNWSSESNSNGRGSWSRQNVPVKPIVPIISPPSQPRQIYRGSGASGVQQSGTRSSSSGQRSGGSSRQRN